MIVSEFYKERTDGVKLFRTYSTENVKIYQVDTGNIYDEAIDVENSKHTYEETNEKIEIIEDGRDGYVVPEDATTSVITD